MISHKKYLRSTQNYYSKVYFFNDCFWRSLNGSILVTEWFQSGFGKKTILKIYIESLKTVCEGVPFSLKFQVRNQQLYKKLTLSQTCLKFRLRGESRYILWGMWGKPYSWGRGLLGQSEGVEETMFFKIFFWSKNVDR